MSHNRDDWSRSMSVAYDYMTANAHPDGRITLTLETLGEVIDRHFTTARTTLRNLVAVGAIEVVRAGYGRVPSVYRIVRGA